ncbi:MAG: 8-amino-7-oxononanoate synthase [Archangiaceae bacterium]|nr:8-amino-7-oxononanoate synthase [Archangiaceae bacterium]
MSVAGPVTGWASEALEGIAADGLTRHLEPLESAQGPTVDIAGRRYVNFSSNDYLGLAADLDVVAGARTTAMRHGFGSGASRLIVGDSLVHQALEAALAKHFNAASALLFNSGYQANVGVLSTLAGEGDVVFSDALNHASIVDGCRLSRARVVIYPHCDVAALERLLGSTPARRKLIISDAVFSMDGDRAPLLELERLARAHGAGLVVDEAHAVGVLGPTGGGLCEELGVAPDVRVGTLGKALGGFGAFVLASKPVRGWLINQARSLIFSTSLPASTCGAALAALQRMATLPSLRERLWRNIHQFSDGLRQLGYPAHRDSAIFSVIVGRPERALQLSQQLREQGILAKPIRPPTVPAGTSRLRFALSAAHTTDQVRRALSSLSPGRGEGWGEGKISAP